MSAAAACIMVMVTLDSDNPCLGLDHLASVSPSPWSDYINTHRTSSGKHDCGTGQTIGHIIVAQDETIGHSIVAQDKQY